MPRVTSACSSGVTTSSPDLPVFPAAGGTAHVYVSAPSGCKWSASADVSWLKQITSGVPTGYAYFTVCAATDSTCKGAPEGHVIITDAATGAQLATHTVDQSGRVINVVTTFGLAPVAAANSVTKSYCNQPATDPQYPNDNNPEPFTQTANSTGGALVFPAAFSDLPSNGSCMWNVAATSDSGTTDSDSTLQTDQTGTLHAHINIPANQGSPPPQTAVRWVKISALAPNSNTGAGLNIQDYYLVVNQSGGSQCNYTLSQPEPSPTAAGGPETISIGTGGPNSGCPWTLQASDGNGNPVSWITGVQNQSGTNDDKSFTFNVTANSAPSSRVAYISIQGQAAQTSVAQPGVVCTPVVGTSNIQFGAAGGSNSFSFSLPGGCQWTASSSQSWLQITPTQSNGSGTIYFTAAANPTTSQQSAYISINGAPVFTVTETAANCSYALSSGSLSVGAAGTNGTPGSFQVATSPANGCQWTATTPNNWITVSGSGSASGAVTFNVVANSGTGSRTGTIGVADQTFTITQSGLSCSYTLSLPTINAAATAGTYAETVTAPSGCPWTAQSGNNWITLDTTSGSGTGTVNVSVVANGGSAPRTGTVSIGPQGVIATVNQTGGTPTPSNVTFSANPNPVAACGSQTSGTTTFTWNAPGVSFVNLYAGSASGTLIYSGPASGSYSTSSVTNGEVVVLTDQSNNVLGQVTISFNYSCSATLVQALMTTQTDFSAAVCAVPQAQTTFNSQNTYATLWFSLQNVPGGSTVLAEFIDPYGNVDLNQTFSVAAPATQYCNASVAGVMYDYPNGFVPATLPGGWTARLSLNGAVLGTVPYYISGPLTYNWTFTANASANDISQPPFSAQTKTFSTNDAGIYTYFSTQNSQAGDVNHLYYWWWDTTNQQWDQVSKTDFDALTSSGTWYFSDELQISGNSAIQQNPGYYAVVGSVTQGTTETVTFQEIMIVAPPAQLQASPSSLTFTSAIGATAPAGQTVAVTSAPSGAPVTGKITNGSPWLSAQLSAQTTPATLTVTVNASGLTVGSYSDSVTLSAPGGGITVPVALNVITPGPVLTSISQTSVPALSGPLTLQLSGQNFTTDSRTQWAPQGGSSVTLQTQFQSSSVLQASVPASLLTTTGAVQVSVVNSLGSSTSLSFQITAPAPSISSISPSTAPAGSPQLAVTVSGSSFLNGTQVNWKGPDGTTHTLTSQYQTSNSLQATVPAGYLTTAGAASIWAANSGVSSNAVTFQITAASITVTNLATTGGLATDSQGNPNYCATPVGKTAFLTTDTYVWLWFTIANASPGNSLQVVWVDPFGHPTAASPTTINYSGAGCYGDYLSIAGYAPSIEPGNWQVEIIVNGTVAVTTPFTIATPTTGLGSALQITGAATAAGLRTNSQGNPNFCLAPADQLLFKTADSAVWVWFTIGNASPGDVLQVVWSDPYGNQTPFGPAVLNYSGSGCYGYYLSIAGAAPASKPGNWQAQILVNGTAAITLPFVIVNQALSVNLSEYCTQQGYSGVTNIDGSGYGWRCTPGNASINLNLACTQQYGAGWSALLSSVAPGGPNDWRCVQ